MKSLLQKHKDWVVYAVVVVFAGLVLLVAHRVTTGDEQTFGRLGGTPVHPATVTMIAAEDQRVFQLDGQQMADKDIFFYATVTSGERKGETLLARQVVNAMSAIQLKEVEEGDRIMLVYGSYDTAEQGWLFQEYNRSHTLAILLAVFLGLMLLFGGKKGIGAMLSLFFTCACIFYFFLPAILSGWNVYGLTVFSCLFIITVTLILINGFNFKSLSAAIGCLGGLLVAGVLFKVSDLSLRLTGLVDEDTSYLLYMNPENPIDLKAIIFASVLIGVLGAVLDVGVSIAASLNEMYGDKNGFTLRQVMTSGMNIGRDIISTMTNTLILAYIGGGLSVTLLLMTYSNSVLELINRETIVVELLQALLGSIGLLFTIPLTTLFYAFALTRSQHSAGKGNQQPVAVDAGLASFDEIQEDMPLPEESQRPELPVLGAVQRLAQREQELEEGAKNPPVPPQGQGERSGSAGSEKSAPPPIDSE